VGVISDIEGALDAHWAQFGRASGATLHDERGLLWFETPIRRLPYNGVIRTCLPGAAGIDRILETFRARDTDAFWFVHPTATPSDLGDRLRAHGLLDVARITCMSLELDERRPLPAPAGIELREVTCDGDLAVYSDLTSRYWSIPQGERPAVARLQKDLGPGRVAGHRLLAWDGDAAVGKGYISLAGPPGVAAIFGMSVLPDARGRGVAAGLTAALLDRAAEAGCRRAVLHATDAAVGIYRRAGFAERCPLGFMHTGTTGP
jgi:ribosomal protein S18 acetylase RimI-like enzyme